MASISRRHFDALATEFLRAKLRAKTQEEEGNIIRLAGDVANVLTTTSASFIKSMFMDAATGKKKG